MNVSYELHNIFRVGVAATLQMYHALCNIIAFTVTNDIEIKKFKF